MTGGEAVILGRFGHNFAAGMTGGMAWVLIENTSDIERVNSETVSLFKTPEGYWEERLRALIERHARETASPKAAAILEDWSNARRKLTQIAPNELLSSLPAPLTERAAAE